MSQASASSAFQRPQGLHLQDDEADEPDLDDEDDDWGDEDDEDEDENGDEDEEVWQVGPAPNVLSFP